MRSTKINKMDSGVKIFNFKQSPILFILLTAAVTSCLRKTETTLFFLKDQNFFMWAKRQKLFSSEISEVQNFFRKHVPPKNK